MTTHRPLTLGVNVDHVATLRQARGTDYPNPAQAADIARKAGADGVTVHLREDRRHIQDFDVTEIRESVTLPMNLEMATTQEMLAIALKVKPYECCLVPEKREELTTEGGLDVVSQKQQLTDYIADLKQSGAKVSLFIDPDQEQIACSAELGADIIELHTGTYADTEGAAQQTELQRLITGAEQAASLGLQVNAGHGLHYQNVQAIAAIPQIECLNIGHSIVARAVISGFYDAVFAMKQAMNKARLEAEGETVSE